MLFSTASLNFDSLKKHMCTSSLLQYQIAEIDIAQKEFRTMNFPKQFVGICEQRLIIPGK